MNFSWVVIMHEFSFVNGNDQTHKEDRVTRFYSINTSVLTIVDGCGKQITVGITLMPEESTDL